MTDLCPKDLRNFPFDGDVFVLRTDAGAGFALGAWEPDPAHLCAAVHDERGQGVLLTLLDDDAEQSLLTLLLARALARTRAVIQPLGHWSPPQPGP